MSDIEYLFKELEDLLNATKVLRFSYEKTELYVNKEEFTPNEENDIEAFTSRFARLSDMIVQKTLRLIYAIEDEKVETVRDRIMKAEKMELIESAAKLIEIRRLRNEIAHDYAGKRLEEIFKLASSHCETLFDTVDRIEKYIKRKFL